MSEPGSERMPKPESLERTPRRSTAFRKPQTRVLLAACGLALSVVVPAVDAQTQAKPVGPSVLTSQPGAKGAAQPQQPPQAQQPQAPQPGAPGASGSAAPGAIPEATTASIATDDPNKISLAAFAEPVELKTLVDLLARTLNINVVVESDLSGSIVFNAPVQVDRDRLLPLVDALLGQQGYTITKDPTIDFYIVRRAADVPPNLAGDIPTTRVIPTPNVRPSALQFALQAQLTAGGAASAAGGQHLSFIDELGIIVATDSKRRLDQLETLVKRMLEEYARSKFIRIELAHIAAPVARQRALELIGQIAQPIGGAAFQPGQVQQAVPAGQARPGGGFDNLGDRLTVDPNGNALIFRGVDEEAAPVRAILEVIDKPSGLAPKRYEVGAAAQQIADIARQRGLGEVTTIASRGQQDGFFNANFDANRQQFPGQQQSQSHTGGPVMVVDENRGSILYYGTPDQQSQMRQLIDELDLKSEVVVIRAYKLNHSDSEKMAELINGLLRNETPASSNPLLGEGGGVFGVGRGQQFQPTRTGELAGEGVRQGDLSLSSNAFVIANKALNQVLVKAPAKQQPDFERLIQKLDQRRPQVYVEARIVAVTADDRTRRARSWC